MRTFSLTVLSLSLGISLAAYGADAVSARQRLLEQIRLGEATKRDDLVRESLYRLELINPDNPDVIAARLRLLLRQGNTAAAQQQFDRLATLAPGSDAWRQARTEMHLSGTEGRQALQQARLLASTGHIPEAIAAYEKLFEGAIPQNDIGVEYWTLLAKLPARHKEAIAHLSAQNAKEPGNIDLQRHLADLLFADSRDKEGYAVLEQMAKSNAGRSVAADIWYQRIQNIPVSPQSVAALQRFLAVFSSGESVYKAKGILVRQQARLAEPGFSARARGIADVAAGHGATAIAPLQQAIREGQRDGETLGALGQAYSQQGNRAQAVVQLEKAIAMDPQNDSFSKWQSLLQTNRYWLLIDQGDAALKKHDLPTAERHYQQARHIDNTDSYAVLGLGDVAVARQDDVAAERFYKQALRMDAGNSNAVRGLANIYRRQSPERAEAFLQHLSPSQRRSIDDIERSLTNERLDGEATALEEKGRFAEAMQIQKARLRLNSGSVWITWRLAQDTYKAGQHREADALFRQLARQKPADPDQVYAYGLYLSGTERESAALAHLDTLPREQWNDNIHELAERLKTNQVLDRANRLRDSGNEPQAIVLLKQQPASDRIDLTRADWAQQRGDNGAAKALFETILRRHPHSEDALLGLAEVFAAQRENAAAQAQLAALEAAPDKEPLSLNAYRRVALVEERIGNTDRAKQIFDRIIPRARALPPSVASALVLRDAARLHGENGQGEAALALWRDAMVASGITDKRPVDNDTFTRLTRNDVKDDWLKRGIRSDAADRYRQQDINVTLTHNYWGSRGTPGYSDLKANTTMLQADAPLYDGRLLFRTDVVNMNAGRFGTDSQGQYRENWGTCDDTWCRGYTNSTAHGASVAVGWRNETWAMDLGSTPMGFKVVDVVGGVSYRGDLGPLGYTLDAHRRPLSSSLLAFGGQTDPNTGITWGGVRATGGSVSISYDNGKAHGVWSTLGADSLAGQHVAGNERVRWMTGYYYKIINENNQRLTVGLSNMLWHYSNDLSGYSLGQGGYYSPQRYVSFSVPVTWRKRTENWSWELSGSVSWSSSKTNSQPRYPLNNLIPNPVASDDERLRRFNDKYAIEEGGGSTGVGYTARAIIERRLSSHWSIGAGIDIQEAKDYTPSHALMFMRYSLGGWQGDMDMPPQPLIPYADW